MGLLLWKAVELLSKDSFTAKADRPLGFISSNISVSAEELKLLRK
jgi:hypothetical protein